MTYITSLLLIAGIYLAVLASPGPNFFILSQMALDGRHRDARFVAFGITTGSIFWVVLALGGVAAVMAQHPWLALIVRIVGAAYIVWYGTGLLRAAFVPPPPRATERLEAAAGFTRRAAYRTGLLTSLTNPKAVAFWTSAFAATFPAQAPAWFYSVTVLLVAMMSFSWHVGIALIFGTSALRAAYLRIERIVNGVAGGALVVLGLQRIVTSR